MEKTAEDWTKADKDGTIHVPDYLDPMINKVGFQMRLHTISGRNEVQVICDIVYNAEKFFKDLHAPKWIPCKQDDELPEHTDYAFYLDNGSFQGVRFDTVDVVEFRYATHYCKINLPQPPTNNE
jgi:hypothetical protein